MPERGRFIFLDTPSQTQGEFAKLLQVVAQQNNHRENWMREQGPIEVAGMIVEEAIELKQACENDMPAIEVASEIGDVLYLTLRLCSDLGIDPRDALEMKIVRNSLKYPDTFNSNGDYNAGKETSREMWKGLGGDLTFYHLYLMLAGSEPDVKSPEQLEEHNGHSQGPDFPESAVLFEKA